MLKGHRVFLSVMMVAILGLGIMAGVLYERQRGWSEGRKVVVGQYLVGGDLRGWDPWMFQITDAVQHALTGAELGYESASVWFAINKTTREPVLLYQIWLPEEKIVAIPIDDLVEAANVYRKEKGGTVTETEFYGAAVKRAREIISRKQ